MKPMIWRPEAKDKQVNKYLETFNHEPWIPLSGVITLFVMVFITLIFLGMF